MGLPQRCTMQRRKEIRQDGSRRSHHRPASFPADSPGDEEVRADVQGPHIGRASQRSAETLLGRRRWQHHRRPAVRRDGRGGDGGPRRTGSAAGCDWASRRHVGQDPAQRDPASPAESGGGLSRMSSVDVNSGPWQAGRTWNECADWRLSPSTARFYPIFVPWSLTLAAATAPCPRVSVYFENRSFARLRNRVAFRHDDS